MRNGASGARRKSGSGKPGTGAETHVSAVLKPKVRLYSFLPLRREVARAQRVTEGENLLAVRKNGA